MKNLFVPITIMPGKSGKSMASAGMTRMALGKNMSKASRQMSKGLRKADNSSVWEQITNAARQASDYASPYMQQASDYASPYMQQASDYAAPYVQNAKNNTRRAIQSVKSGYYGSLLPELALLQNEWKKGGPAQSGLYESPPVDSTGRTVMMPAYTRGDIGNRLKTFGLPSRVKQNQYNDITERERSFAPLRALGEYLSPTPNYGMAMTGPAGLPRNYRTSLRDTMGVSPETVIGGAGTPRIGGELVRRYSDADIRRMMAPARMKNEYTVQGKAVKPRNQIWNTGTMSPDVNPFETFVAPKPQPTYNRAKGRWDTNIPSNVAEPVSEYERKQKAPRRDVVRMTPAKPTLTGLVTNENYINMGKSMGKSMQKGRFSQLAQSIGRSLGSAGRKMRRNAAIGLEELNYGAKSMRTGAISPSMDGTLYPRNRRTIFPSVKNSPLDAVRQRRQKYSRIERLNRNPELSYGEFTPKQLSALNTSANAYRLLDRAGQNARVNREKIMGLLGAGLAGAGTISGASMMRQKQTEPSPYGRPMGKRMSKASTPTPTPTPYTRRIAGGGYVPNGAYVGAMVGAKRKSPEVGAPRRFPEVGAPRRFPEVGVPRRSSMAKRANTSDKYFK